GLALAPAAGRGRGICRFVDAGFVAGIGAILRYQRIDGRAQEAGLIAIHERIEGGEGFRATVAVGTAGVGRVIGGPGLRCDGAAVGADLEQFITGFEGLPDTWSGSGERLGAVGETAMSRVGQGGPVEGDE